jgi:hypothetical protein
MSSTNKQVVAVFLWSDETEPGLFCLSPPATSLLLAITRAVKQSGASSDSVSVLPSSTARESLLYPASPAHKANNSLQPPSSKRKGESGIDLLALVGESHATPSRSVKRSFTESSTSSTTASAQIPILEAGTPSKRMAHEPPQQPLPELAAQATQQELLMHLLSDQLFTGPSASAPRDSGTGSSARGVSASGGSTFTLANQNADAAASAAADAMALSP